MTLANRFEAEVRAQFLRQPLPAASLVTEAHLALLPEPVAKYVRRSGAVGLPVIHNLRVTFDATMYRAPDAPLPSEATQYEFVDDPSRYFFLQTRMLGMPVRVLHEYEGGDAHMQVRLAGVVNLVNEQGRSLSRAETVTVLNDFCIMAPSALLDGRCSWEARTPREAVVQFTHGRHTVGATLHFNDDGDLVNFISDDRHALDGDGDSWSTPLRDYQNFDGRRVASEGDAIWLYEDGRVFRYGTFRIRDIRWNVSAF